MGERKLLDKGEGIEAMGEWKGKRKTWNERERGKGEMKGKEEKVEWKGKRNGWNERERGMGGMKGKEEKVKWKVDLRKGWGWVVKSTLRWIFKPFLKGEVEVGKGSPDFHNVVFLESPYIPPLQINLSRGGGQKKRKWGWKVGVSTDKYAKGQGYHL